MIKLHSLGACYIQTDNGRITPESRMMFGMALYLILERGKRIERDTLCWMFWPKVRKKEKSRARLRQLMHKLRGYGFSLSSLDEIIMPDGFASADCEEIT
jgi:DNA-binding SARP family transcriptional activator